MSIKFFSSASEVTFKDLVGLIYTESEIRGSFESDFIFGFDYFMDSLLYNGFISPKVYLLRKIGYPTCNVMLSYVTYRIAVIVYSNNPKVDLPVDLLQSYIIALAINSNEKLKQEYFDTNMYGIGALASHLYCDGIAESKNKLYKERYISITDSQWEELSKVMNIPLEEPDLDSIKF